MPRRDDGLRMDDEIALDREVNLILGKPAKQSEAENSSVSLDSNEEEHSGDLDGVLDTDVDTTDLDAPITSWTPEL